MFVVSRKKIKERKERTISVIGAVLLVAGGWAVFSLIRYGFTELLLKVGIEGEVYQNLVIILLVVLFFILVAGNDKKSAFNKLLKL